MTQLDCCSSKKQKFKIQNEFETHPSLRKTEMLQNLRLYMKDEED